MHNSLSHIPILSQINLINFFNHCSPRYIVVLVSPVWLGLPNGLSPQTTHITILSHHTHYQSPAVQSAITLCCHQRHLCLPSVGSGSNFDYPENGLSWVYSACPCRMWDVSNQAAIWACTFLPASALRYAGIYEEYIARLLLTFETPVGRDRQGVSKLL
jgi:hypothetical protein